LLIQNLYLQTTRFANERKRKIDRFNKQSHGMIRVIRKMRDDRVYLTFDDGPDLFTASIMELLNRCGIKGTFFLIGQKAAQNPEIVKELLKHGHSIGNHSFSHPRLILKSRQFIVNEIDQTDAILTELLGFRPCIFRPPYGLFGWNLLRILQLKGYRMALWNGLTKDYAAKVDEHFIGDRIRKQARPGAILLMHDGHSNSEKTLLALEETLPALLKKGLKFGLIPNQ